MLEKFKFTIIFTISLIISSCIEDAQNGVENDPTQLFDNVLEPTGERFEIIGQQISAPTQLLVVDSLLIVHDHFDDGDNTFFFGLIDKTSGEFLQLFGREGRGPDEFLNNSHMFRVPGNSEQMVINNRRVFSVSKVSLNRIIADSSSHTINEVNELNTGYSLVSKVGENLFFGTGMFSDGRFGLSDSSGEFIHASLEYPFEEVFEEVNVRDLGMAFQSTFSTHPDKPLIAVANFTAGNLDIVSFENDDIEYLHQIHSYPPKFENQSSESQISVTFDSDNRMGYWDIDGTENYIYALYSGRKRTDPHNSTGNQVLIFNWEGSPVAKLNLHENISSLAITENDEMLYAVAQNEEGESYIISYQLKL